jgi:hypothetical protein
MEMDPQLDGKTAKDLEKMSIFSQVSKSTAAQNNNSEAQPSEGRRTTSWSFASN